jgi:hypothetical protein
MSAPALIKTSTICKSPRAAADVKAVSPFSSCAFALMPAVIKPLTAIASPAAAARKKDDSSNS